MSNFLTVLIYAVIIVGMITTLVYLAYPVDFMLKLGLYPASDWTCAVNPNIVPFRRNSSGDIECQSEDGKNCRYVADKTCQHYIDNPVAYNPLACGDDHNAKWGMPGYNSPEHWCSIANKKIAKPHVKLTSYQWI